MNNYHEKICANCGGIYGLHNYHNKRCPVNINSTADHTEYRDTVFTPESQSVPPVQGIEEMAEMQAEKYRVENLSTYNNRVQENGKKDYKAGYIASATSLSGQRDEGKLVEALEKCRATFQMVVDDNGDATSSQIVKDIDLALAYHRPQPTLPASIVQKLREANPYDKDGMMNWHSVWNRCCDILEQLIGKQGEGEQGGEAPKILFYIKHLQEGWIGAVYYTEKIDDWRKGWVNYDVIENPRGVDILGGGMAACKIFESGEYDFGSSLELISKK